MNQNMMTLEELANPEVNISLPIIEKAFNEAEKRLCDILKVKDGMNSKALFFLNVYIPVLTGIIGSCFFIITNMPTQKDWLYFLFPLSWYFCVSILFYLLAFRCIKYGYLGSMPEFWLQEDTVSGNDTTLSRKLAYLAHSYQEIIILSFKSNWQKKTFLHAGLYLTVSGMFMSFVSLGFVLLNPSLKYSMCFLLLEMVLAAVLPLACYFASKRY